MRIIGVLGILLIFLLACESRDEAKKKDSSNEIENLKIYYYPDSSIHGISTLKNDTLNGFRALFYEDFGLKEIVQLKNDTFHGVYRKYYPNGKLRVEFHVKDTLVHGPQIEYYETGVIEYYLFVGKDEEIITQIEYDYKGKVSSGKGRFISKIIASKDLSRNKTLKQDIIVISPLFCNATIKILNNSDEEIVFQEEFTGIDTLRTLVNYEEVSEQKFLVTCSDTVFENKFTYEMVFLREWKNNKPYYFMEFDTLIFENTR